MVKLDLEQLGYLYKLHNSQWKKGWFVLRHGVLYKYHNHEVRSLFLYFLLIIN